MRIDHIAIENFKNYESLEVNFVEGVNLFVGNNGSGKTTILEAVNVAVGCFFGSQEQKMQRPIEFDEIRLTDNKRMLSASVSAASALINEPWARGIKRDTKTNDTRNIKSASEYGRFFLEAFENNEDRTVAPLIAYYSTQRLFKDSKLTNKQKYDVASGRRNGYLQCLKEDAIKGVLNEWLENAVTRRATRQIKEIAGEDLVLENVEKAVKKCLILFLDLPADFSLKIYQDPDFDYELFVNYDKDHDLPLSYYSDGFRNIVYLVIDLIWRASQLNPWLTLDEIAQQVFGVVTIDEIDLHLHPKWQAKSIKLLQELLPKVQFFITTHSATVVANFEERENEHPIDSIFMLEGQVVRRITNSFFGQDVNSVLGNPMDASSRAEKVVRLINEFEAIAANSASSKEDYDRLIAIGEELNDILPGTDLELIRINDIVENVKNAG